MPIFAPYLGLDLTSGGAPREYGFVPAKDPLSSAGGGYAASAVHFDGATWLTNASLTAVDSQYLSYSMWLRVSANVNNYRVIAATDPEDGYNNWMFLNGVTRIFGAEVAASNLTAGAETSSSQPYPVDTWFHVLGSYDTSIGPTGRCKLYIDNVAWNFGPPNQEVVGSPGIVPFEHWNALPLWIGADSFADDEFVGDMADVWIAPNVYLLDGSGDIPTATLRRFISASGKPQNPAGFPSGAVLLSGNAAGFATNQGTGGSFTTTGTLTNASSSPSD